MRHAARLRLVVDNSSSESSTPCSRAMRSKGRCQSPGMVPRTDHIPTALRDAPGSSAASSAAPPKRPIISETGFDAVGAVSIETELATNGGQSQQPTMAVPEKRNGAQRVDHWQLPRDRMSMSDDSDDNGTINVTLAIREMMGRIQKIRHGETSITPFAGKKTSQEAIARKFGDFGKTAYGAWERCEAAPPIYAVINFATEYNLSLDYLMRGLGPPQPDHIFSGPSGAAVPTQVVRAVSRKTKKRKTG